MREGKLSINIETLLDKKRIEFKADWNANTIYRSICAFANDFDNIGGGYILIGVQEDEAKARRPVKGLTESEIAKIQKETIGFNTLIRPSYAPILSIEMVDNNNIIALWVSGGTERPY
jgi:ATP-dependent DNA helicase RecG